MTDLSFDELVTVATIGVANRELPAIVLAGPAGVHSAVLNREDPAATVLDAAALLITARRAGPIAGAGEVRPAAAPDTAPELSPGASAALNSLISSTDAELIAGLLRSVAAAGQRIPAPLLAILLDAAVRAGRRSALAGAVTATLGNRGRWLAAQRPDWHGFAAGPATPADSTADVWDTGSQDQRLARLRQLRAVDPGQARDLLATTWSRETGEDRERLLATFIDGLSEDDEGFLEAALADRSTAVGRRAGQLLARLPRSAFTQRAADRAAGLLRVERRGLRRRLIVTMPAAPDQAATRDGIQPPPRSHAAGPGAWLLAQYLAAAPLRTWPDQFGLSPQALVELPVEGGFQLDVLAGWRRAARRQHDADWAQALLAVQAGTPKPPSWLADPELAIALPPADRARRVSSLIRSGAVDAAAAEVDGCPAPWPAELAAAVLGVLIEPDASGSRLQSLRLIVQSAARQLPVSGPRDYGAELLSLDRDGLSAAGLAGQLARAAEILNHRRRFHEELR